MEKELRYRVIYGYNSKDYVSITDDLLEKAKYAMVTGKIFNHSSGMIKGSEIKRIESDFRFYTGWYDSYQPKEAEDWNQIERDVPTKKLQERLDTADKRVQFILKENNPELLQSPEQIFLPKK